jgi:murein L,D-transpeptidase YafK
VITIAVSALAAPPCPATVDELPPSSLYEAADPRLAHAVVVLKERRIALLLDDGALATTPAGPACWTVALASGYVPGHKQRRGDLRTPEGWYRTSDRPWSAFRHALTVHYPSPADGDRGLAAGLVAAAERDAIAAAAVADRSPPMETRLGGQILLHGGGSGADWTLGCVAFEDEDILALRALLPRDLRADVLILP